MIEWRLYLEAMLGYADLCYSVKSRGDVKIHGIKRGSPDLAVVPAPSHCT